MRVHLKGLHTATKRLADGTRRTYYYAWKGGPRIEGQAGSPAFVAAYNAAMANRTAPATGIILTLIAEYRRSTEYTKLRPSTRRDYDRYLADIEVKWGQTPIRFIAEPGFRGDLKAWRDTMAATPRKADLAWAVMARVLSVAKDRGRIRENPCARGGRLYKADRVDSIWTDEMIEQARAGLPKDLGHAMMLALWTGQRQGDLLTLPWSSIDGNFIRLKQSKGGRRVTVRIISQLRELLDGLPRLQPTILTNSRGTSWTASGFRASWGKAVSDLGITGVTFHDLRGSAVTRLAEAGCNETEIASITGHSSSTVSVMLDKHYLSRTDAISTSAGEKLEAAETKRSRKPDCKLEESVGAEGLPQEAET